MTASLSRTLVTDVLGPTLLDLMLTEGYVRKQVHPSLPLSILNYSEKTAYERVWNDVTRRCRGLIYNHETNEVVARPFSKFWNYGEPESAGLADLDARTVVTDKLDGSLGILYPLPSGGHAVATRGSFASEQALHATKVWNERYADRFEPHPGYTMLFEIVYPENRIVCDYGNLDDLVLLGAVDTATGRTMSATSAAHWFSWPGLAAQEFPYVTLAEALAAEPRPNAEGLVVHFLDADERLKIKQEDYVKLHRIVTGLTARTVWQHMVDGLPLADLIEPLPDEFHGWVRDIADGITEAVDAEVKRIEAAFDDLVEEMMPAGWDRTTREGRKDFAMVAVKHPDKWAMFNLLDGKDIRGELLKRAKPEPYVTPSGRIFTEDNA